MPSVPHTSPRLSRVPLVPDSILKEHNIYFECDSRFRRSARLLQTLWLADHGIPTGVHISRDGVVSPLGSCLDAKSAEAGLNFMSPVVHRFVRKELAFREEGALYDEQRLFSNSLSSSPAVFNIFGPLALDLDLATNVFRRLLPAYVTSVEGFMFEHSPGRHDQLYTADGTAVDLAVNCTTPEGETLRIFVEFKLSETLDSGPIARDRPRYAEASCEVRLFREPDSTALRSLPLEQLWREAMLSQLSVDRGLVQRGVFVAIAPRLNRHAHQAFAAFADELIEEGHRDDNRVPFVPLTLETVIDVIRDCGATEVAGALWARYADFDRVARVVLDEIDAWRRVTRCRLSMYLSRQP